MALSSKAAIKIGNYEFVPQKLQPIADSLADENSGRTADGVMHIRWIRNNMTKLQITLPPTSHPETVLSLVQGKIYTLTYYDITTGTERTKQFYTSNSKGDTYSGVLYGGLWRNVSFNAIEV